MTEEFDVRLDDAFRRAADHRDQREAWRTRAQADPLGTAARVREAIPEMLAHSRAESARLYGIDVSDPGSGKDADFRTLAEAIDILHKVNRHRILLWAQQKLDSCAADSSLSEEEHSARVCEVGFEMLQALDALLLHNLHQIRSYAAPGEATRLAEDAEATLLAGYLATRISVAMNRRLAKALDDIREHNKPANRARFEALLRELYTNAPQVWDEHHELDWQLNTTRNTVVKKIEKPLRQGHSIATELAAFTEREALLSRAREVGLTPREHDLFGLVMGDPGRFFRNNKLNYSEAARELGLAVGTVKSLWSRIRKTFNAA